MVVGCGATAPGDGSILGALDVLGASGRSIPVHPICVSPPLPHNNPAQGAQTKPRSGYLCKPNEGFREYMGIHVMEVGEDESSPTDEIT